MGPTPSPGWQEGQSVPIPMANGMPVKRTSTTNTTASMTFTVRVYLGVPRLIPRLVIRNDRTSDSRRCAPHTGEPCEEAAGEAPGSARGHPVSEEGPGVGHLRQEAGLLGFALMTNSMTLSRHRAREHLAAA